VLVLRRDGRAVPGATVRLRGPAEQTAQAGADGRASFGRLPAGEYTVDTVEPGLVQASASVALGEGGHLCVDLFEPWGWTACVTVLDEEGRPVPFASLEVSQEGGAPYAAFSGDVQHAGLWTDRDGRATLRDLSSGAATVTASHGTRKARATIAERAPHSVLRLGVE